MRYADYFPEYAQYFVRALKWLKSMYGMTNSVKLFDDELTEWLIEEGFMQSCQMAVFSYKNCCLPSLWQCPSNWQQLKWLSRKLGQNCDAYRFLAGTLPGLAENFANLCTAKLKSTLVDNKQIKYPMQAL